MVWQTCPLSGPLLQGGYVVLTNYRLIWIGTGHGKGDPTGSSACGVPCHLPLLAVSDAEHRSGLLVKAARIKLAVRVDSASYPTAGEALSDGAKRCALKPAAVEGSATLPCAPAGAASPTVPHSWSRARAQHALPPGGTLEAPLLRHLRRRHPSPLQTFGAWHAWRR